MNQEKSLRCPNGQHGSHGRLAVSYSNQCTKEISVGFGLCMYRHRQKILSHIKQMYAYMYSFSSHVVDYLLTSPVVSVVAVPELTPCPWPALTAAVS